MFSSEETISYMVDVRSCLSTYQEKIATKKIGLLNDLACAFDFYCMR